MGPTALLEWLLARAPAEKRHGRPFGVALTRADVGALGEELAARHLVATGFQVLGRNVLASEAELDLVARERASGAFVVIEVKTGWWPPDPGGEGLHRRPSARVTDRGLRRRVSAARRMGQGIGPSARVDVIEVIAGRGDKPLLIHHRGTQPGWTAPLPLHASGGGRA